MAGVVPQVVDRVPAGFDPQVVRRQSCRTNGALSALCSRPSAVVSLAADQAGALALAAGAFVAPVAVTKLVAMANMMRVQVLDPDGSVVMANILVVPGLVVLK